MQIYYLFRAGNRRLYRTATPGQAFMDNYEGSGGGGLREREAIGFVVFLGRVLCRVVMERGRVARHEARRHGHPSFFYLYVLEYTPHQYQYQVNSPRRPSFNMQTRRHGLLRMSIVE